MLSDAYLKKLDALTLALLDSARGAAGGARRSKLLGTSAEFSDFREYAPGDDIRRIDWNAYARFDRLFLKLFTEERETMLTVALDASASMASEGKWEAAVMAAETLLYLALTGGDRARVALMAEGLRLSPVFTGRAAFPRARAFLQSAKPEGALRMNHALRRMTFPAGKGICAVISDFLSEDGYDSGPFALKYRGQTPMFLQVLSGEELAPSFEGAARLIDSESGNALLIQAGARAFDAYDRVLKAFLEDVSKVASRLGAPRALLDASMDFEATALRALVRCGAIAQ